MERNKKAMRGCINFVEKNIRSAWVIWGQLGIRQYYGYTKSRSIEMYKDEYWKTQGQFVCQ